MSKKAGKKEEIYCVFCGTKNNYDVEKCSKCKKSLHPKNHLFREFLYEHIRDDLKGKVTDNIFSYLKNFIISHLYGAAMTVSVIFAAISIGLAFRNPYKSISAISNMQKTDENSNEVIIRLYTYDDSCWGDFDERLSDIPFATAGAIISGNRMTTAEVTIKKGTTLNDWCKDNHEQEMICAEPLTYYDKEIEKTGQTYRKKVLDYAAWVRENGTKNDKEYARRNSELEDLTWELIRSDNRKIYDKNQTVNKSLELYVPALGCMYWS